MLNRLQFNNFVITNKKKIKQGRVQTINKLVQKIKKIKTQFEKPQKNEKHKERLRKSTECLEHIKKLKCVDLVKNILVMEKNPTAILTNGLSTPEELAIALLAMNKIIHDFSKTLKQQLNLNEANVKWREELLQASKRREKINRTENKKKKRKDTKEQKAIARKRLEWIKENAAGAIPSNLDTATPNVSHITTVGGWKIEPINAEAAPTSAPTNNAAKNILIEQKENSIEIQGKNNVAMVLSKTNAEIKSKERKIKTKNKNETVKTLVDLEEKIDGKDGGEMVEHDEQVVTHVVDPFFITDSGENYLSTAVILRDQQQLNNAGVERKIEIIAKPWDYGTEANGGRFEKNVRNRTMKNSNIKHYHQNPSKDFKSLHPSWVAKQKLKPVIASFQGKKITFDHDENAKANANHTNNSVKKKGAQSESIATKQKLKLELDNLHPSWAAKQKLKPSITTFVGKKIKFANDFDED